jgi:ABC-type antimicrobial peptide transport system permease subunit
LSDVRSISDQLADARAAPRASAIVSSAAALLAVLLALLGVYGVLMTSVEQRRHELAIRAALGATPREIVRRVVREGCTLTIIGLVAGMIASVGAGRLIADQLFEVQPQDALVMATVPLLVLVVSGVAWLAPARRAARVDPVGVLKSL